MKLDGLSKTIYYKHRYVIGFAILFIFAVLIAGYKFWAVPGGLSEAEIAAATVSGNNSVFGLVSNFSDNVAFIINLPWNILQQASVYIFGLSIFSIRLPAVILMIASLVGLVLLLRRLLRPNIALVGSFLAVTSVLYFSLSRSGTAAAMTVFLTTVVLLAATNIIVQKKSDFFNLVSKILVFVAMGLLLYSPGGVYVALLFILSGLFHPKARLLFIHAKIWKLIIGLFVGLVVVSPLIVGIFIEKDSILPTLLLFNGQWSLDNLGAVLTALFSMQPDFVGGLVAPVTTLVGTIIIAIGIVRALSYVTSARSYLVLPFLLVAISLSLRDPSLIYLLFIPLAILTAFGLETIVSKWYSLFPKNPYARTLAIIPLTIMVLSIGWASTRQFINTENYSSVAYSYNYEFSAAQKEIESAAGKNQKVLLVVNASQQRFYELLAKDFSNVVVSNKFQKGNQTTIVLASSAAQLSDATPKQVVADWRSKDPVVLRVY